MKLALQCLVFSSVKWHISLKHLSILYLIQTLLHKRLLQFLSFLPTFRPSHMLPFHLLGNIFFFLCLKNLNLSVTSLEQFLRYHPQTNQASLPQHFVLLIQRSCWQQLTNQSLRQLYTYIREGGWIRRWRQKERRNKERKEAFTILLPSGMERTHTKEFTWQCSKNDVRFFCHMIPQHFFLCYFNNHHI